MVFYSPSFGVPGEIDQSQYLDTAAAFIVARKMRGRQLQVDWAARFG
jgi:hypothetical protein